MEEAVQSRRCLSFCGLALLVEGSKDEVCRVVIASVDRQWLLGLDEIIK